MAECESCARLRAGVEVVCLRENERLTFRKGDFVKLYDGWIEGSTFIGWASPLSPNRRGLAMVLGPPKLEAALRRDVAEEDIPRILSGELAIPARVDHGEPGRLTPENPDEVEAR